MKEFGDADGLTEVGVKGAGVDAAFCKVKNKKWGGQREAGGYGNKMDMGDALTIGLKIMDIFNANLVAK